MDAAIWFDGACSGNPGPGGAGAVVEIEGQRQIISKPMGKSTNNEAEYGGLIEGLKAAKAAGASRVVVHGDSQLVIRQLEGRYRVKAPNLERFYVEAKKLIESFDAVELHWIRREQNADADRAARDAVGGTPSWVP